MVRPWYEKAQTACFDRLPPLNVVDEAIAANAETKYESGSILMKWRLGYPASLYIPSPNAADLLQAEKEIEYTACHDLGHGVAYWLRALGMDVEQELYIFRGFAGTAAQASAAADAMGVEPGWQYQPREQVAETMRAAIGGRWVRPERTFNEGREIDPGAARTWMRGLVARAVGITVPAVDCAFAEWIPSPNYAIGGNARTGILDHWTVTTSFQAALNTLTLPNGAASVSSHYLIGRDGRIAQLVHESDRAFHVLPEFGQGRYIGIEHQHMPGEDWPTAQLEASARLHRDIAARNAFPLIRPLVLGHRDTGYATACPGDLPIDRLLEDYLNMEITETRLREIIKEEATTPIRDAVKAGFGTVLNQKLRRTARWLKFSGPPGARDPGGVGGNETTGYPDDNTPLA